MKKRFLSLILAFAMLLPLIPAWSISISAAADNANELTEAEAFAAGLDVYVAWYNHRGEDWNTSDHIKSIYEDKNSSFNRLFAQIYPDGPASKGGQKLLGEAKVWLEDHYDGIDQFAQKENEIAMAILLACLLFTAKTDVSSDNEIMDLEEFSYQATKNGFSLYNFDWMEKARAHSLSFSKKISFEEWKAELPTDLSDIKSEYSMGVITSVLMGLADKGKNAAEAVGKAATYDTIVSASKADIEILRNHQDAGIIGPYIKLYLEAYEELWEKGTSPFLELLLEESVNPADVLVEIAAASLKAGIGELAAGGGLGFFEYMLALFNSSLIGFELFNIVEGVWKMSGDFLFGQTAMRVGDVTLFYLDYIRTIFYTGYGHARKNFYFYPTQENARILNNYTRFMYRLFAASEMYASDINNTYAKAGILNAEWMHYIPGKIDPALTDTAKWQSRAQLLYRDEYLKVAYEEYLEFCDSSVYNIFLNMNGGVFLAAEQLGMSQSRIPVCKIKTIDAFVPEGIPYREGFAFLGWTDVKGGTVPNPQYAPGSVYRRDADIELYAVWNPVPFNIVFDANGGSYSDGGLSVTKEKLYLQSFTIDFEAPVREGYDFLGWSRTKNGGVQYKHAGANGASQGDATYYDIGGSGTGTKTLYAVWRKNTATFTYDYSDCTTAEPITLKLEGGSVSYTLEAPEAWKVSQMGKDFICWKYYYSDGRVVYYNIGDTITVTEDMIIYAEWEDLSESVTLSVVTDKNSYLPGDTVKIKVTADNSEYFVVDASSGNGFSVKDAGGGSSSRAVFAERSSSSNAGTKCYDNGSEYTVYLTVPASCADGIYFVDISVFGVGSKSETLGIRIDTAREEVGKYLLSYNINGGSGDVPENVSFEENEYVVLSKDRGFERLGYEFAGWSESSDGSGRIYKAGREYKFSESLLLYAVWEKVEEDGELGLDLLVERYSKVYKPGETAHVFVYPHNSNHFYFDVSSCSGFTLKNSAGDKVKGDTWIDKTSPNYDSALEGYNDNGMIAIYIYIPKDCPDGQYTFYCTASNGLLRPDNTSGGDKVKKSVTINVRRSDKADLVELSKTEMTLHVGDEKKLVATVLPSFFTDKEVTWKTSNKSVISLDKWTNKVYVSGIKSGEATVTATVDGVSATCKVTVVKCDYSEKWIEPEYLASKATCTSPAKYYYVCSCGEVSSKTYDYGKAAEHIFTEWSVLKNEGEFEAGIKQRQCKSCGHLETEAIPATGHRMHTAEELWLSDDISHWQECRCGEIMNREIHRDNGEDVCSVCLATLAPVSIEPIVFSLGSAEAERGETVEIRLEISANPGFAQASFELEYDRSVLSFRGYRCDYEWEPVTNYEGSSSVYPPTLSWDRENDLLGEGTVLILAFDVDVNASKGEYSINLVQTGSVKNSEGRRVQSELTCGAVTVKGGIPGDCNGNKMVDIKDAVLFAQHLAGWLVFIDLGAADCNGDGAVNTKDAVLLSQYLAGWNVELK